MVTSYCVVPHYDALEPTEVKGWCVVERTSSADRTINCYPTREEAQASVETLNAQANHNVA